MPKHQGQSNFQNQGQSYFQNQGQPNFQSQGKSNFNHQGNRNNQQTNFQNHQSSYQSRPKQNDESSTSLKTLMKGFMTQTQASIKNLETQIGQVALEMRKRPVGALPRDTETPQREEKEHVKAVTFRSENLLPENIQKDSEPPIKAVSEKVPTTLTSIIPAQSPDISGPKNTSKPSTVTSIPEKSDSPPLISKEPLTVQKPQERITVDLSHSGASPTVISKNQTQEKPPAEPLWHTPIIPTPQKNTSATPIPPYIPYPQRLRIQKEQVEFNKFLDKSDKCSQFCSIEFSTHEKGVKDVLRKGLKHKWKEKIVTNCSNCQVP